MATSTSNTRLRLVIPASLMVAAFLLQAAATGEAMETGCWAPAESKVVDLPKPRLSGTMSVEAALQKRRSVRQFADAPLSLAEVSQILWAAQGVTSPKGLRAAPSAGALYPLELYLVAGNVTGLAAGIYRYLPERHALAPVRQGDRRGELPRASLNQAALRAAPASLVFSAVYARTTKKYGERGIRYVHMDVGHAAENVYLQAVALGLGTVVIGGFDDTALAAVLCLPPGEEPIALMPVGRNGSAS